MGVLSGTLIQVREHVTGCQRQSVLFTLFTGFHAPESDPIWCIDHCRERYVTGGRIRHHLKHNVWREDCHIIIVGYQERGTLGRALVDGVREISLWGEKIRVAATVHTIGIDLLQFH